ncbi:MAG: YceI family protein [Proteobacteria bacterium]|nr:YceI family protein [Pseudomonadota bacterium]
MPHPAPARDAAQHPGLGFDPVHTRFGFELRTRWGQRVHGAFPQYQGELRVLPDGRHQVHIRLATAAVEVGESERYTAIARGDGFFDAERHPLIEFVSEPHQAALAHRGGQLRGTLSMHGTSRLESFTLTPSGCARPGIDCDVVAEGSVSRGDYGLDGWKLVLGDRVRFSLRVRLDAAER